MEPNTTKRPYIPPRTAILQADAGRGYAATSEQGSAGWSDLDDEL